MKTKSLPTNLTTQFQPDSPRSIPRIVWLSLTLLCLVMGLSKAQAQSNILSINGNYAGQCNTAYPMNVAAYTPIAPCVPTSPWSISLSDSAGVPNVVSVGSLVQTAFALRTAGGAIPTLNLMTLVPGPGTVVVTDPCGNTATFGFNIVSCSSGSALVPVLGYQSQIAPNNPATYTIQVVNVGPNPSTATTLEVTGILPIADCTVVALSPGMSALNLGGSQKISVPVGVLSPGASQTFSFTMQATLSAVVGSTFTINAGFTSTYPYTDFRLITVVASLDPNAKYGNPGGGAFHSIASNTVLPYLITFENDPSALAPAQIVRITDQLDTSKTAPESVEFGPVFYGNQVVTPPAGTIPFSTTVPYDVDGNPITTSDNIYVRITGDVDKNPLSSTYGKVEWMFESLDAPFGSPPPFTVGFLPANIIAPEGQGGVSFTVMQKQNLTPGTIITNDASIVFDLNAPILTPVWTNRIRIPSTLSIEKTTDGMIKVDWSGGTLEESDDLSPGQWSDSSVQTPPKIQHPSRPKRFFRVREH
jgi:hypothetical protein